MPCWRATWRESAWSGSAPGRNCARRESGPGRSVKLAAGHSLKTEHEMLDGTGGLEEGAVRAALERLAERGCEAIAVSGAYSVDYPEQERRSPDRA